MSATAAVSPGAGDLDPPASQLLEVLNGASGAFVGISGNRVMTAWNAAVHALRGWSADEAVGRCVMAASPREARDRVPARVDPGAVGRLSAELAHEINSPMQFVGDNARFLAEACQNLLRLVHCYRELLAAPEPIGWDDRRSRMQAAEENLELGYLEDEVPGAVEHVLQGIERVSAVLGTLRTFSRSKPDEQAAVKPDGALEATVTTPA